VGRGAVFFALAGCVSGQTLPAGGTNVVALPPRVDADTVARSQKPDGDPANGAIRRTVFEAVNEPLPRLTAGEAAVSVRAHVNGVPILDEEVRDACLPQLRASLSLSEPDRGRKQQEIIDRTLQTLIDTEVILQDLNGRLAKIRPQYMDKLKEAAAHEFGKQVKAMKASAQQKGIVIKNDDDLRKILLSQGMSLDSMRRQKERDFIAMEYMRSRIFSMVNNVGHQEILEYYQQHTNEFQIADSVDWQDIFIDASKYHNRQEARQFADRLIVLAGAGQDFSKLAAQYGHDTIYGTGEGYGHLHGEIKPPEAEPILFHLKEGQVGPVIEVRQGFHVIRVVKRDFAGLKPLDAKTQGEIRKKLQNQVANEEYKRLLAELKRKATIEIASYGQ
jgi:parvulin-like peptidyl-prolyl isomerase